MNVSPGSLKYRLSHICSNISLQASIPRPGIVTIGNRKKVNLHLLFLNLVLILMNLNPISMVVFHSVVLNCYLQPCPFYHHLIQYCLGLCHVTLLMRDHHLVGVKEIPVNNKKKFNLKSSANNLKNINERFGRLSTTKKKRKEIKAKLK